MNSAAKLRALLVDDHQIMVEALKNTVPALRSFARIDTANSLQEACQILAAEPDCQLAILDLHLDDADGRDTLTRFREQFPDVPVLVCTGDSSLDHITMAFECGARGYVTKKSPVPIIDTAVRMVIAGGVYIPPDAAEILGLPPATQQVRVRTLEAPLRLSGRQEQVFQLLLQGMPNKVIGARLNMAEGTVKAHLNSVFTALGVRTRVEAILKARQLGLV